MKCTACGLPLSPSRTNASCPRCGTAMSAGVGAPSQEMQWGQAAPFVASEPPMMPISAPQAGQMWTAGSNGMQGPGSQFPMRPAPKRPPRNAQVGFLIAGICVLMGGILLVVVYAMAMSQSGNPSTANTTPTSTHAASSPVVTPSSVVSPSPSATSFPAQQYLNNAQMSSVQPSASQPALPTTSFKVKQTFYVVFNVNSGGQGGEVCLKWYLNGKFAFPYQFPVGAHTTFTYGQAVYSTPGPAYVELYWANNASCANEALAQHVDFTITP